MQPQFQSSFIPKGPVSPTSSIPVSMGHRPKQSDFLTTLATLIFFISVALAAGVFGYKFYLINNVTKASADIEAAKQRLSNDSVNKIMNLNDRIISTKTLIDQHVVISPVFEFLETSTPKSVTYTIMDYQNSDTGILLNLEGLARDYSSLAVVSDVINKNRYFKNVVFSDLSLDAKGNVAFKVTANIDQSLVSYRKMMVLSTSTPSDVRASTTTSASVRTATSTATSTPTNL